MRLRCFHCHKPCSTEIPDHTVVRGTVTCPDCEEQETTALEKGTDGWHYEGKPAHRVVIEKFLEGLQTGVVLKIVPPKQ